MKRKITLIFALAALALNFSSCVVREERGDGYRHGEHHHHHHHDHDEAEIIVR